MDNVRRIPSIVTTQLAVLTRPLHSVVQTQGNAPQTLEVTMVALLLRTLALVSTSSVLMVHAQNPGHQILAQPTVRLRMAAVVQNINLKPSVALTEPVSSLPIFARLQHLQTTELSLPCVSLPILSNVPMDIVRNLQQLVLPNWLVWDARHQSLSNVQLVFALPLLTNVLL